jgi:hypothetical protein
LLDIQALHWLNVATDPRTRAALNFLLQLCSRAEDLMGQPVQRLSVRVLERVEAEQPILEDLYAHARWIAFALDGALTPHRDDRKLGPVLALRNNELVADRPPPIERAPGLGVRVANLVGLAPPSVDLLAWACRAGSGAPLAWDESAQDQFWLLLRAADWRAWDFLNVT